MRWLLGGIAAVCASMSLGILWTVSSGQFEEQPHRAGRAHVARVDGSGPGHVREARASEHQPAAVRKASAARSSHLEQVRSDVSSRTPRIGDAQERAGARQQTRDELVTGLLDRVQAHASTSGWTDETLGQVEDAVIDTTAQISESLHRVDVGEVGWEEVKREVRQIRLDQAGRLESILGETKFRAFVGAVAMERFEGEEPRRGRL